MGVQQLRYKQLRRRMRRSLYYGPDARMDTLSLPLTELAGAYFHRHSPFDRLDGEFATHLNREACIAPSSLIVALVYLERLRTADADAFTAADPNDLYLAALLLASKWLHDDGEKDAVYNDEWAASARKELAALNRLELSTLGQLDWDLNLSDAQFRDTLGEVEAGVARLAAAKRNWSGLTYTEIFRLLANPAKKSSDEAGFLTTLLQPLCAMLGLVSLLYTASAVVLSFGLSSLLLRTPTTTTAASNLTQMRLRGEMATLPCPSGSCPELTVELTTLGDDAHPLLTHNPAATETEDQAHQKVDVAAWIRELVWGDVCRRNSSVQMFIHSATPPIRYPPLPALLSIG